MKNLLIVFLIIIGFSKFIYSQDSQYFDAPFGGGGGFVPGWYVPSMDGVNLQLKSFSVPELSTKGFYTSGGTGFIYLGFIPQLRIGGMGFGGSTSSSAVVGGQNREVIYSLGGGGLTLEYTLPFLRDIGISVGTTIGRGTLKIELYKNSGSFNWGNIWNEAGSSPTNNYGRTLEDNYWFFTPTLNFDIPLQRFVNFRVGTGYQFTFGDNWSVENGQDISGVPSSINGKSFFIQSGIFIGFFSY